MNYQNGINEIVELVKLSPNETDTRVEAEKILKRFLYETAAAAEQFRLIRVEEEDIMDIKIGGTC